jgi:antitoxin component of MazEF toxin-antitoxin module
MITVNIRKQGSEAIITIPADVLKMLDVEVGRHWNWKWDRVHLPPVRFVPKVAGVTHWRS